MLKVVRRDEAEVYPLPGRDWLLYIGPQNSAARNLTVGVAIFPAGSAPQGHIHPTQEETIYIVGGRGRLVTGLGTAELEPGVAVFIPMGVHHATESDGPEPLELVSVFSPPVEPGSYEAARSGSR
jgi:quercetin dioxygenase-like cupin family protein